MNDIIKAMPYALEFLPPDFLGGQEFRAVLRLDYCGIIGEQASIAFFDPWSNESMQYVANKVSEWVNLSHWHTVSHDYYDQHDLYGTVLEDGLSEIMHRTVYVEGSPDDLIRLGLSVIKGLDFESPEEETE